MIRLHSSRPVKGVPSDLFAAFWKNSRYRDSRSTCHRAGGRAYLKYGITCWPISLIESITR